MGNPHIEVSGDPIPQEVLDYCKSVSTTEKEFAREKKAYLDFCERYSKERDGKKAFGDGKFPSVPAFQQGSRDEAIVCAD